MTAKTLLFCLFTVGILAASGSRLTAADPNTLQLQFKAATFLPQGGSEKDRKKFRDGLSGIAFANEGRTLFLACGETVNESPSLEQLIRQEDGSYGSHQTLLISQFMPLICSKTDEDGRVEEIDMEGLVVGKDQYLYFVGSHSANRKEAKDDKKQDKNLERLAKVDQGPNRLFIGRIPLVKDAAGNAKLVAADGARKAGRLNSPPVGWDLCGLMKSKDKQDQHFGRFFDMVNDVAQPVIPSKDNGFDIEGMAVVGRSIYLGLRGPVLRGTACILEIQIKEKADGNLELDAFDGGALYRKHFVDLGGLGIRDLHLDADGDSLWILSGPTQVLDGPTNLRLWKGAITAMKGGDTVTFGDKKNSDKISDKSQRWQTFIDLGNLAGKDHPEGIAALPDTNGPSKKMVVLCDGVDEKHAAANATDAKADVVVLP